MTVPLHNAGAGQTRTHLVFVLLALALASPARNAFAQSRTATLNVSINGLARLTLSSTGVSFPDSNPDAVPQVPGTPGPLVLTVKARTTLNATVRLSVLASDDLRSGVRTLPGVDDHVDRNRCGFRPEH